MAHQSLYRKYRPQTFGDVVGQEHIERTLMNAVAEGKVAHAYLFTGPRGTGKTTTARILAKALDCQHGPTPEPDGTCEECIEIAEGRHPDVYELDAASRTGVDNVREEIIGRVDFAPSRGRYKVYIIDEVHMLSTAAFNALLKTLEEPPSRVVFVLATTHPHKVPETIQSRCQRFDFRRIGVEDIVGRLRVICDGEGFDAPDAALALIARHARGGMRDAITTLEQLASFTSGTIRLEDVEGLLGEVDAAQLFEIAGLVARRDVASAFRWVARFAEEGTDIAEFVRELTGHVRNLYVVAAVGEGAGVIDAGAEEIAHLESQAREFGGPDRLARVLDLLGELGSELRWSSDPRLSLEVSLTRMARPEGELTLESLAERVEGLERTGLPATAAALRSGSSECPPASPANTPAESSLQAPTAASADTSAAPRTAQPAAPAPVAPAAAPTGSLAGSGGAAPDGAAGSTGGAASPAPAAPATAAPPAPAPAPTSALDRGGARRAWPAVLAEIKKLKPGRAQLFALAEVDIDSDGETLVVEFPSDQAFSVKLAEDPDVREVLQRALQSALGFAPPVRYQLGTGAVRPPEALAPQPALASAVYGQPEATPPSAPVAAPAPARTRPASTAPADDDAPLPEYYETASNSDDPNPYGSASARPAAPVRGTAVAPAPAPAPATAPWATPSPESSSAGGESDLRKLLTQSLGAQIITERAAPPDEVDAGASDDDDAAAELAEADSAEATFESEPGLFDENDD